MSPFIPSILFFLLFWQSTTTVSFSIVRRRVPSSRPRTVLSSLLVLEDGDVDLATRVARKVQPSMALVTPMGVRNMTTSRGSGFVVEFVVDGENDDATFVITSAHVAIPGCSMFITLMDDNGGTTATTTSSSYRASVVGRNYTLDLALLKLEETKQRYRALSFRETLPLVGTVAFSHGFPASRMRGPAMTSGIVCGIADGLGMPGTNNNNKNNRNESNNTTTTTTTSSEQDYFSLGDDTIFVVTDAAMSGGMSGGPLVDATGRVMGVNALIRPDLRALGNYAVSAEEVKTFLHQLLLQQHRLKHYNNKNNQDDNASTMSEADAANGCYQIWLFNDPMNKKQRVSEILQRVANMTMDEANTCMMSAHTRGRGIVANFTNPKSANIMCEALRKEDILVDVLLLRQPIMAWSSSNQIMATTTLIPTPSAPKQIQHFARN